ncbi:hypothetical protein HZI73_11040 [Vallitalea pronyensis]|uniref:Uncharacterized protein n=1 Tax=Vallitalea pronyensis TaxID=1348613 RepID=A0A8J8MJM2_9FIRM|nr:hypothetical protein [Vallitalea pronyensis]QUI22789.1 hypothetical protein HZI73_11040 [Vallitalea pronyensis]
MIPKEYTQYALLLNYNILVLMLIFFGGYMLRKIKNQNKIIRSLKAFYMVVIPYSIITFILDYLVALGMLSDVQQYYHMVKIIISINKIMSDYMFTPLVLLINVLLIINIYKHKETVITEGERYD